MYATLSSLDPKRSARQQRQRKNGPYIKLWASWATADNVPWMLRHCASKRVGVRAVIGRGLGGRQRKETWKGGQRELVAPRLNISILKPHWQPGHSEYSPIISIQPNYFNTAARPVRQGLQKGGGRGVEEGKKRKMALTHRTGWQREVTSSWPFQRTWPSAVWRIMEPQMGQRGDGTW